MLFSENYLFFKFMCKMLNCAVWKPGLYFIMILVYETKECGITLLAFLLKFKIWPSKLRTQEMTFMVLNIYCIYNKTPGLLKFWYQFIYMISEMSIR